MKSWPVALVLVLLVPGPMGAQVETPVPLARGDAHIRGLVVDRTTGDPVVGATVVLEVSRGLGSTSRTTDDAGVFHFASVPLGSYHLAIRRLGFHELTISLGTDEGTYVEVDARMVPSAVELDPIVVTTTRRDRLAWVGFRERQRTAQGRFFTRDEIQRHRVTRVSQLFRGIAGFRLVPARDGYTTSVIGRGNCLPALYLDGVRMANTGAGQVDQLLSPDHLEGLEVYSGVQTPGQFRAGSCGTIVAWSHTPSDMTDHPFQWRRLVVAGGLGAAVFLFFF